LMSSIQQNPMTEQATGVQVEHNSLSRLYK
jgi:hypothetical protein